MGDGRLEGRDGQSQLTPTHAHKEKGQVLHQPPCVVPSGFRSKGTILPDTMGFHGGGQFISPCHVSLSTHTIEVQELFKIKK